MSEHRIVFLDIDGVVCCNYQTRLEKKKLERVAKLTKATGAKVVLSSDWRREPPRKKELLEAKRLAKLEEDEARRKGKDEEKEARKRDQLLAQQEIDELGATNDKLNKQVAEMDQAEKAAARQAAMIFSKALSTTSFSVSSRGRCPSALARSLGPT